MHFVSCYASYTPSLLLFVCHITYIFIIMYYMICGEGWESFSEFPERIATAAPDVAVHKGANVAASFYLPFVVPKSSLICCLKIVTKKLFFFIFLRKW